MSSEEIIQWLLIFVPLAISPGPANILFAASGSSFGVKASLPFWLGTNLICLLQTLAIGFGLGFIISKFPSIIDIFKYIGVLFLFYLAFRFFKQSTLQTEAIKPLSFKEGVVVEFFNAKYLLIPTIMFTQFYSVEKDSIDKILILTLMLAILTMLCNFIWIYAGRALILLVMNTNIKKLQNKIFGLMLCLTAIWLIFS